MIDAPQPAPEPYEEGDRVRIYLAEDDLDERYHALVCRVTNVEEDDLGEETERTLDALVYTLEHAEKGRLGVTFRHRDLVPTEG